MRLFISFAVAAMIASVVLAQAPATVYEDTTTSPQNMDFDSKNNMFVAHSGWYNDKLIHYYKFRMYTPGTYPGVIAPGGSNVIPIQPVYMVTTDGGFGGVVGSPVITYHTADGLDYSDFMEVNFVEAPADYVADSWNDADAIMASGATITASGIILNLPVVPTGATLQDPIAKGTTTAPINPTPVWYMGDEVWTYVFEVTDQTAADFFAPTRVSSGDTAQARAADADYAITVVDFATADSVRRIPIWHLNQFSNGVVAGENGGGPNPAGMRNVINLDRGDAGYSPLWQVFWATEVPMNYSADEASNAATMTEANGFKFFVAPMFVNCPDIGPVGGMNALMSTEFQTTIDLSLESNIIIGSDASIIMQEVELHIEAHKSDGSHAEIAHIESNMMGGYEYTLMSSDVPVDAVEVEISVHTTTGMNFIRSVELANGPVSPAPVTSTSTSSAAFRGMSILAALLGFFAL